MVWNKSKECLLLLLLLIFLGYAEDDEVDNCNLYDCKDTLIACNNYGDIGLDCTNDVRLVSLNAYKHYILDVYNEIRNEIANGELSPFPPAKRMATMQWSSDLADLASLRTMRCTKSPENCYSTKKFEEPGQGAILFVLNDVDFDKAIGRAFQDVLNARHQFYVQWVDAMPQQQPNPILGHFALAIRDNNAFIGCSASISIKDGEKQLLFVCNYAYKNFVGYPIYSTGYTASACKTGINRNYSGLCSPKEVYDFSWEAKYKWK